MIDRITIDKIMDTANIVDVVSDFVTLKRAGANLKGLCPFHDDRTPSFMVSPAKNLCKCFACGEGGSPLNFIMKHEQLSYPDALRYLARKYGIPFEEKELSKEEKQSQNDRESMFIINEWAKNWFIHQLYDTPDGTAIGLAYFRNRGFRDDIVRKFEIGYCPNGKTTSIAKEAIAEGYEEKYLVSETNIDDPKTSIGTGLCLKNERGELRDRFHDRVMWPIFTMSGRVAGFGGRVLDARTHGVNVKYQNSPESIVYSKRRELFGLYQAKQAIRLKDLCYLVEGYTDVMAMHQNGLENVVASSGTALTFEQIRLIKRLTNNITLIFDGDSAGIKASLRGTDMLLSEGMNVKLLLLPDGEDPDSFGRKRNATEYQAYMAEHQIDFIQYKTETLMKEAQGDPSKQGRVVSNIVSSIAVVPDEITRVFYIQQASQMLQLEVDLITKSVNQAIINIREEKRKENEREINRIAAQTNTDEQSQSTANEQNIEIDVQSKEFDKREQQIVEMVIRYGEQVIINIMDNNGNTQPLTLSEVVARSLEADKIPFQSPLCVQILNEAKNQSGQENFIAEKYFLNHRNPDIAQLAFTLLDKEELSRIFQSQEKEEGLTLDPNSLYQETMHLLLEYKYGIIQSKIRSILRQTKNPNLKKDKNQYRALTIQFMEYKEIEKRLAKECGERVLSN